MKIVVGAMLLTTLAACGGGSSSSGGSEQQKEVTALCIQKKLTDDDVGGSGLGVRKFDYQNTCDFPVTLALYLSLSSRFNGVITLAPMQVHKETESALGESFIACRTPSVPKRTGQIGSFKTECS